MSVAPAPPRVEHALLEASEIREACIGSSVSTCNSPTHNIGRSEVSCLFERSTPWTDKVPMEERDMECTTRCWSSTDRCFSCKVSLSMRIISSMVADGFTTAEIEKSFLECDAYASVRDVATTLLSRIGILARLSRKEIVALDPFRCRVHSRQNILHLQSWLAVVSLARLAKLCTQSSALLYHAFQINLLEILLRGAFISIGQTMGE